MFSPPAEPVIPSPQELRQVAEEAARAGGAELLRWQGKFATREKGRADLVTDADMASQVATFNLISSHFPDHACLGEENPAGAADLLAQPVCWVVDPLDGTTNYVHNFPGFAVSIGVVVNGRIAAGVIYDPVLDEMYSGALGSGAFCNGFPMKVSGCERIEESLIAMSLPAGVAGPDAPDIKDFLNLVGVVRGIRRTGSAALNLAYVAQGRLDGHWARLINPWDVAAGVLLVELAGGRVTGCDGAPLDLANPHMLATSSPALHDQMLAMLARS